MKKFFYITIALFSATSFTACDKYLDIEPEGKVIPKTLEENRGLITTAYQAFPRHKSRLAFRADELQLNEYSTDAPYYKDIYIWKDTDADPQTGAYPWIQFYNTIFYTNHIINQGEISITASVEKEQLIGEAHALRAYAYFDLANLYGKPYDKTTAATDKAVPLALEVDLEQVFKAASVQEVYQQVLTDIEAAKNRLHTDTQELGLNYRFSKAAIFALEARVHLYMNHWEKALEAANKALAYNNSLVDLNTTPSLPNSFDSPESILALEDVYQASLNNAAYIDNDFINSYDQENDLRFGLYFVQDGSRYKSNKGGDQKFKCSFRVAELYLIKAEALLKSGNTAQSKEVLLSLMENRYTKEHMPTMESAITNMASTAYEATLFDERAKELALEGHKWFDLRRTTQKEIKHTFNGDIYTLDKNDPRYTLLYPKDAKLNNPDL
ncbi:RagB/SusD family nutrient uptake outer membrane protein [Arenibacter sp. 6A1]|uniref:RagB/SusD family nutrient uptake outer membrane protein n=1 Tax=Arenibacter sp. 6A1 TaxID=2720391 RepID=UPI0014452ED9|nr:RagB/SusD family nutrient uptake outer membrane protein [Arenibacter sp. 6A1]NKI26997.1 RagB/SusD family nutrient uptake outer membrane protein [Arenibacter sp. 6A1]